MSNEAYYFYTKKLIKIYKHSINIVGVWNSSFIYPLQHLAKSSQDNLTILENI